MSRRYNLSYKKGKYGQSIKATRADLSKTAWKNLTTNSNVWNSDRRKFDMPYIDTGPDFAERDSPGGFNRFTNRHFKYSARSKLRLGKKPGRENLKYRRYWYKK